ncbi:MAG: tetratricopeptide repeat protein [Stenotrophobium sp.]
MNRLHLLAIAMLLTPAAHAAETYLPGSVVDPNLRESTYLTDDDRSFSALTLLLGIGAQDDTTKLPPAEQWQLEETYLSFGMADKAEAILSHLAAITGDHQRLAKDHLRLAEFYYQRGYLDRSHDLLERMRGKLPGALFEQWQDLLSRVLMAKGNYSGAADVLTKPDNASKQSPYTRYNLGVALINSGHDAQGRDILDHIGRMRVLTLDDLALRDKANLTLGWHFLHDQLGGSAAPVFERVRSAGPFSNRALLGLGWAELAARGKRQAHKDIDEDLTNDPFTSFSSLGVLLRPGFLDRDVFMRAGLRTFRLGSISSDEQTSLRRALAAWVELINRDPMDPAVNEGWLAIPYSLDRLGAHTEALQYYEQAIKKLEASRQRAIAAMTSIRQGRMVETIVRRDIDSEAGWNWVLHDLPDAPETYYLQDLLAEHPFQEALKNYRDMLMMERNLDSWKQRLDTLANTYKNADRPAVAPEILFKRATAGWTPPWPGPAIKLRTENTLGTPGSYDAKLAPAASTPVQLTLGAATRFDGEWEQIQSLQTRADALRPLVADMAKQQSKLLQDMATKELEGQEKEIEKYLVEARFALARLYDRQMKGQLNDK